MQAKTVDLSVGAIVWATGWEPYDANRIDNLGFGQHDNIITNMMLERLASNSGPTHGKILRPSDDKAPESVAFVQCAGSRDENHLPYCSYICCMASLKHATYIREQYPDTKVYIFYIDIRSPGDRYEKVLQQDQRRRERHSDQRKSRRGQPKIRPPRTSPWLPKMRSPGRKIHQTVEMAVLATGMQPTAANAKLPADLKVTMTVSSSMILKRVAMFAAGCANKPLDVISSNQNATGMALKAIQTLVKR
jgi:quinone-modifying oxidoreductase subunit QmoA